MAVGGLREQLGLTVDISVDGFVAEHILPEFEISFLHGLAERGVLQQALPHGRRRIVARALETPGFKIVGISEITVAIGQIIIPYGTCYEAATAAVGTLPFLVEICTTFVAVGIETELSMNEIVDKRRNIDIAGIAVLTVGKEVGLNDLLHGVDKALDILQLLGHQLLFLRVDARPNDFAGHATLPYPGHGGGKRGIVLVERVDAQQVASSKVAPTGVGCRHTTDVYAVGTLFDGFGKDINAAVVAIKCQFHKACSGRPMAHFAP